jgi:aminoglycoside phosphotransferase (APT) family kinase protein
MSFVEGTVFRTYEQLADVRPSAATELADGFIDVLARLHSVDAEAVGLGDLGRPSGYLERQVRRWGKQLEASRSRELPELADLGRRLREATPASQRTALVHGDYKLDNVVVAASEPARVLAILDWEMATLGDPMMDLVNVVLWWDGIRDTDGVPFAAVPAEVPGFPPSSQLTERYAAATGASLDSLHWYLGLACYKVAAIFEGIFYRDIQGHTVGEGFERIGGLPPALARRGHEYLDRGPTG